MFFYQKELDRLNAAYLSSKSNFIFVDGMIGVGKTCLLERFAIDKKVFYYQARNISDNLVMVCDEVKHSFDTWTKLFEYYKNDAKSKLVIILDNFELLFTSNPLILQEILEFYVEHESENILIILSNSSINIKKRIFDREYSDAYLYLKLVELKPLNYRHIRRLFPVHSIDELVKIYGVTGGIHRYLTMFEEKTFEDVIVNKFLSNNKDIQNELDSLLLNELRNLTTYNMYLMLLARNVNILNDLHKATGAERAKISVYLNNLIELNIVKKDDSLRASYLINNQLLKFYYRFIFPNLSLLFNRNRKQLYKALVEPFLEDYLEETFKVIVKDYLMFQDSIELLPFKVEGVGKYIDKNISIDLILHGNEGEHIFANCYYLDRPIDIDSYYLINSRAIKINNKEKNNYYYLFSKGGFTQVLQEMARSNKKIRLVSLEDIFNI